MCVCVCVLCVCAYIHTYNAGRAWVMPYEKHASILMDASRDRASQGHLESRHAKDNLRPHSSAF
jgi:hypothetical protein